MRSYQQIVLRVRKTLCQRPAELRSVQFVLNSGQRTVSPNKRYRPRRASVASDQSWSASMHISFVVILFSVYGLILIVGLLHVARELITAPSPRLPSYSDSEPDRDDELMEPTQSPFAASTANYLIDEGRRKREQP